MTESFLTRPSYAARVVQQARARAGMLFSRRSVLFGLVALLMAMASPDAQAQKVKPGNNSISLIPTITSITRDSSGNLVATGFATAVIKGKTTTAPFTAPVNISLAADQTGAGACPILDLELGPINLNLLGLVLETSPICLTITAFEGGGLLGDLLCSIANLLNQGVPLSDILDTLSTTGLVSSGAVSPAVAGVTVHTLTDLLSGLTNLFNAALPNLNNAILTAIAPGKGRNVCGILSLELGPLTLELLGLVVELDDCNNGPVTVDITAVTGRNNLLGNLLCDLLDGGLINIGSTLQQILNQILGLLNG
jgi:hypothetical protein